MAVRARAVEAGPSEPLTFKECAKCRRTLPVSSFRRHKGHGDGYDSRCKQCMRQDQAAKKRLAEPSVQAIAPKDIHELPKRVYTSMVKPFLTLRAHWFECEGCERCAEGGPLVMAAAAAFELFYNTYTNPRLGGLPDHGRMWAERALAYRQLLLNVPPRHGKTTIMGQWFPIWLFACDRNLQVIIISKTIALGEKSSRKIAGELESNQRLIQDFGRFRPEDLTRPWRVAKGELEIEGKDLSMRSGDLSLQVRGSGQQVLGMEADWVIADDLTDRGRAKSETERETEWDYFLGDVLTRMSPEGRAFCIGQRVHESDIYGRLARHVDDDGTPAWHQIKTPAILDEEEGLVLWPKEWPFARLVRRRKAMSSSLFMCMFQQMPEVAGEFVERWWFEGNGSVDHPGCYDRDRSVGAGWRPPPDQPVFIPTTRVLSIDPSPTAYCGIVVADVIWQPRAQFFYAAIVDIRRDKMGLRNMVDEVHDLVNLYGPQVCIFETNIAKWLHEDPAWNRLTPRFTTVIGQNTTRWNKEDTLLGMWSVAADFEAGRIRFPYKTREDREVSALLVDEALAYPNGSSDDVLHAMWFIKANYKTLIPRNLVPTHFDRPQQGSKAWDMQALRRRFDETRTEWPGTRS